VKQPLADAFVQVDDRESMDSRWVDQLARDPPLSVEAQRGIARGEFEE